MLLVVRACSHLFDRGLIVVADEYGILAQGDMVVQMEPAGGGSTAKLLTLAMHATGTTVLLLTLVWQLERQRTA